MEAAQKLMEAAGSLTFAELNLCDLWQSSESFYYWMPDYIRQKQRRSHKLKYPRKKCQHFQSITDLLIFDLKKVVISEKGVFTLKSSRISWVFHCQY